MEHAGASEEASLLAEDELCSGVALYPCPAPWLWAAYIILAVLEHVLMS